MKALLYIAMCPSPLNQQSYSDLVPQVRAISVIVWKLQEKFIADNQEVILRSNKVTVQPVTL